MTSYESDSLPQVQACAGNPSGWALRALANNRQTPQGRIMAGSLTAAARLQSSIVHAILMQDMSRRYGASRVGLFAALVEPLIFIAALYLIRVYVQGVTKVGGVPIELFLVTGMLTFFCFRYSVNAVSSAAQKRGNALMFPQVTPLDAIISQAVASCTIYAGVMLSTFVLLMIWTGIKPTDTLWVFFGTALTLMMGAGVGVIIGSILRIFPALRLFVMFLLRLDLLFSGAFFMAAELPRHILPYVNWNPTFHTIEMMREGWFPGYVSPFASAEYVVQVLIFVYAIGLALERITRSRL